MKKNSLKKKLEERLSGGKFRLLNEMLYTSTPKKIENYHILYANQQKKWSYHPLEKIIPLINQSDLILDIGCGEGILSQKFKYVINFDLFSKLNNLIKGNSNSLPFKDNVFDTAIFCLSLMSVDNTNSIKESCRVVKEKGNIIIGEIISRIVCVDKFIKNVESTGLCLIESFCDEWYFIGKFKKIMFNNQSEEIFLKPCVYKKR